MLLLTAAVGACSSPAPTGGPATTSPVAGATTSSASTGDFSARVTVGGHQVYLECHGSGHLVILERYDEVNGELDRLLSDAGVVDEP